VFVLPPGSQIGPISLEQRAALIAGSLVAGAYEKAEDRESAFEKLRSRAAGSGEAAKPGGLPAPPGGPGAPAADAGGSFMDDLKGMIFGSTGPRGGKHEGLAESAARSAIRSMGSSLGREITRGVLGSLLGGSKSRR